SLVAAIGNMKTSPDVTMETSSTPNPPPESGAFTQPGGGSTGMPGPDKLIAAQNDSIKGFPLKQVTHVRMASGGKTTIEMTSTTSVSNVKEKPATASTFALPPGFRKVPNPIERMMGTAGH